jgi:signal transduction histidine kinase/CheY-like chemotaxis protein
MGAGRDNVAGLEEVPPTPQGPVTVGAGAPSVRAIRLPDPAASIGGDIQSGRVTAWLGSRRVSILLAFLAIFTMGPLVLLSTLSVNSTYSALTEASSRRLTDASALAAAYVNTEMTSLAATDDAFARRPSLIGALRNGNHSSYDKTAILATLNTIRAIQSNTRFAGIVDAAGTYWGDQDPEGPPSAMGQNFSVRDWYQGTAKTGKPYVSAAYTSSDQGAPLVVAISDPVKADGRYAPTGKVLGILVVGYELSATQRLFSDFAKKQGVAIEVTDQNGVIVALSDSIPTSLVVDKRAAVVAALKGQSAVGRFSAPGEDYFAAYTPVAAIGWTVVTKLPASLALADANRLRGYVIAITILLLALLGGTEIVLYLVFRDGKAINLALTGANSNLEQRVAARTRELEASNRDLKTANHHKTIFLANMSHELRTPLSAIIGFSELLINPAGRQFPVATSQRFLEQIHSSGKHLLGLITDILDLSKIEAGHMELRLQTISVAEVIAQVVSLVEPLADQRGVHLEAEADTAGEILADKVKVTQMILNLVSNAIKFSSEAGRVTITAARVANRMEIRIADDGIGIAEEDLHLLFKEFQQLDSGVGPNQHGTGLGLTLTRSFAILHGGDIRVASELGKGSVFTIDLPLEARSPGRAATAFDPNVGKAIGGAPRPLILVVEDDPVAAELLTRQLEQAGYRCEIARTGAEAVTKAREFLPVAITLDILLPDHDGWEILRRLKLDEVTSGIPVVVVSVVDNAALGTALGALDYFVKPVDAKELINRLSEFNFIPKAGKQTSVLVVDDEVANREWLRHVLQPAGFSVTLAGGGRAGISMAKRRRPGLVILDLKMPEVSGFDVVDALRADPATRATPIMVLTSEHLTEADLRQLSGRVSAVVRRGSTDAVDLLQLLQDVLSKRGAAA